MRSAWILGVAALLSLAGCTTPADELDGEAGPPSTPPETTTTALPTTTTATTTTTTTSAPENRAPVASLAASVEQGQIPFNVTFDLQGSDLDGHSLTWTLDVDGDGEPEADGTELPDTHTHTFDEVGNWTARLTVDDGKEQAFASVTITATGPSGPPPQSFFFTPDNDADTCLVGFLVADLLATEPEAGFCNGAPANAVLTAAGEGLVEVAVAEPPALGFPAGTPVAGAVYVRGTAGSPIIGSLNVSIEKEDGTVVAMGVHEIASEGLGTVAAPFSTVTASEILEGDTLVWKMNFAGASAGYTFGTGEESPTGFTLGGAHPDPVAA